MDRVSPKALNKLDLSDTLWFEHPECIDWDAERRNESKSWLRTPIALKKLEHLEQQMTDGYALSDEQAIEYAKLEEIAYNLPDNSLSKGTAKMLADKQSKQLTLVHCL